MTYFRKSWDFCGSVADILKASRIIGLIHDAFFLRMPLRILVFDELNDCVISETARLEAKNRRKPCRC
jgi:hypothetical protein